MDVKLIHFKEEHWLAVFKNRVLRTIFGLRNEGIAGVWRKLHDEEL
jgi:hypothetical protein